MEGHSSWKPNEQGGDSLANDWRSQHEPDLRKKVIVAIVEKLKICLPRQITNNINKTACTFEAKMYGMAKDKRDYLRKIHEKIHAFEKKFRTGSSANGATTPDPVQALNQGKSLPTSLTYAQTPTSQQWLPQNNIQSNLNIPDSSGLPTQVPITTVSAAQNLNIQMGEGVESNLGPGPQRQIQGRQQLLQKHQQKQQMDEQLLKEKIHHRNQQQHNQKSLLGQQQLPHHRTLYPIKQSFPQSPALSSLPSSSQRDSQFLPRHQVSTQRVHSSHQQQMAVPYQEHKHLERKYDISQLMTGQDTQQTHLTSPQNNGEKQRTSQQNNMASFKVHGSSLFRTQGQEVDQSQPMMLQHSANPSAFKDSTSKTLNPSGGDWREETYQKIKALREKYILVLNTLFQGLSDKLQAIDSLPQQKMPHEQVKKLRAFKGAVEQVLVYLNVSRSSVSEKHRDMFSIYEEHVLKFAKPQSAKQQQQQQVNLPPSQINQTALQSQSGQVHVSQTATPHSSQTRLRIKPTDENKIMSSSGNVVVHSPKQNPPSNQREVVHSNISQDQSSMFHKVQFHHLPTQEQLLQRQKQQQPSASSPQMQNYSSPQLVEQQTLPTTLNKTAAQEHPLVTFPPEPISERPIDRLIKAIQSSSPESLAQSVSEMSSVISLSDRIAGLVHPTGGSRPRLGEDLSERTRLRLQQGVTNPTKRFKRSMTTMPLQSDSYKGFCVNKIEPSYALLQEIREINGRFVETVVSICNEDVCPSEVTSGLTVVTCSYVPVALSPTLKALYNSGHISQIQPLRLLVPENYPYSPIILEKTLLDGASVHKHEDLSARARSRFGLSMRKYSEAMSLKEIAKVWDECARATLLEYVERHGGGTFSSKYGRWESVLRS